MSKPVISVLGSGAYGTALAVSFAKTGIPVLLWGRNVASINLLEQQRQNIEYLPGIDFPSSLRLTANLSKAVECDNLLLVVPSFAFSELVLQLKPHIRSTSRLAWATKGLDPTTGRLFSELIKSELGNEQIMAVLSGPTFAKELAQGMPTAIDIAANDHNFSQILQQLFHATHYLTAYLSDDLKGVQLGGVMKNIIAIGVGIADGLGYGANARISLITRGLAEMIAIGEASGAKASTFKGMSGLGDLMLTCTDNQSRNRRFGLLLGQGYSIEQAHQSIAHVVEGYSNCLKIWQLANELGCYIPIINQVYQVLFEQQNVHIAMDILFTEDKYNLKDNIIL